MKSNEIPQGFHTVLTPNLCLSLYTYYFTHTAVSYQKVRTKRKKNERSSPKAGRLPYPDCLFIYAKNSLHSLPIGNAMSDPLILNGPNYWYRTWRVPWFTLAHTALRKSADMSGSSWIMFCHILAQPPLWTATMCDHATSLALLRQ